MSLNQSSLGLLATKERWTRSWAVATFLRFFTPFFGPGKPWRPSSRFGPGKPWRPSSRMIFHTSFLLTMSPCSISKVARIRNIP